MSSQKSDTHIIVVMRWAGSPDKDWYPWLEQELKKKYPNISINILNMPNPQSPTIEDWVPTVEAALKKASQEFKKIYCVGHSVGCQSIIRALDKLQSADSTFSLDGVLLVASWFFVDKPWSSLMPWIETPVNTQNASKATSKFHVVISDNDQYTSDWQSNKKLWEERIPQCQVHVISGAKHFNESQEPCVLAQLERLLSSE